jgi:hypothetical protein
MTLKYLTYNKRQNYSVYKYMNLKRKLLLSNAHIDFNKTCPKENITPRYAKLSKKVVPQQQSCNTNEKAQEYAQNKK